MVRLHKISSQSVQSFLSNVVHRQTDGQTNKQTKQTNKQMLRKHDLLPMNTPKYKNIQESRNRSQLILLLNNNKKYFYEKLDICDAKYCYKMKMFSLVGWVWQLRLKIISETISFMHKQTTLKHIMQVLKFITINI